MKIKVINGFFERGIVQETSFVKLAKSNQLPVRLSYWFSKLLQQLIPLEKLYLEQKQKLIEKWCDRNEDGTISTNENGTIRFTEHLKEFNVDITELLNIENELPIEKIELCLDDIPTGIINSYDYAGMEMFVNLIV